ncbi:L-tryptophan decarboxylase [Colletotrichum fructicola Nara gc5]|uniref:L-tryptophan decarboxylase n=1 Tax=Colletotrichum fructicola (strain Nara gc5) TaxID=1213859 RepID=A0A7J6IJF8_COLFN|nr:L-tryptophan decarboxylase [Colletotrichum fructicola Nara gc5]
MAIQSKEARVGRVPSPSLAHRIGGWLPHDPKAVQHHVSEILKRARANRLPDAPPIKALRDLIKANPNLYMLFTEMLTEVPTRPPYNTIPGGGPEIRDLETLILALNYQIQHPIGYNDSAQIDMLDYWGWLSQTAQTEEAGLRNFLDTYVVPNPDDPIHYGFDSWDHFFTRDFKHGLRPLACPHDDNVIVSATESTPFYIRRNVSLRDTFWVKNPDGRSNYSLVDMLGNERMAQKFVGGTVYQAFLSADSYHNWHAPVSGSYVEDSPRIINGAYYSEPLMWGFSPDKGIAHPDIGADELSQSYISAVAKRGVAYIKADNPDIGLMAVVMIGMAEVSSVEFFDKPNGFKKGDKIGRFHFGGSTHCLIFGPNVKLSFNLDAIPNPGVQNPGSPIHVLSRLATVNPSNC